MNGKIKFYNEDKGFGKIYTDEKDEYFFHISKIKNKPEKIYNNDLVEFEGFSSDRGLNAKNIHFKEKVLCPVCGWANTSDNQNCTNKKCKFDLLYSQGFVTDEEELEKYQRKINEAKSNLNNYKNQKQQVNNTLKGKIISYDEIKGEGQIRGNDSLKYSFEIKDTNKPLETKVGKYVKFNSYKDNSKLVATKILIERNTKNKDTKIKINDDTILIKYIITYELDIGYHESESRGSCWSCDGSGDCYFCDGRGGNNRYGECDECHGSGECNECDGTGDVWKDCFSFYTYSINLFFSNGKNKTIYLGSWDNEEEKENNEIYYYGQKIIQQLDDLC